MIIIYTYIFPAAERFQGSLASVTHWRDHQPRNDFPRLSPNPSNAMKLRGIFCAGPLLLTILMIMIII